MAHVFNSHFSRLETEERRRTLPADEILAKLNLTKDMSMIDFGCGIGYFSIPAAKLAGKVIAIDMSETMIEELKKRTKDMDNIEIVKSDDIKGKADLIFLSSILHEVDEPRDFLKSCEEHLNPGGRIAVIDWQKIEMADGPPMHHRISREEVIGMTDMEHIEHDIHEYYYFLEFTSRRTS